MRALLGLQLQIHPRAESVDLPKKIGSVQNGEGERALGKKRVTQVRVSS